MTDPCLPAFVHLKQNTYVYGIDCHLRPVYQSLPLAQDTYAVVGTYSIDFPLLQVNVFGTGHLLVRWCPSLTLDNYECTLYGINWTFFAATVKQDSMTPMHMTLNSPCVSNKAPEHDAKPEKKL